MIIIIINNGNFFIAGGPTNPGWALWQALVDEFYLYIYLILFLSHCYSLLEDTSVYRGPKAF